MTSSEREMADAYRAGYRAAVFGRPRVNPYSGTAATARERTLSKMWARGYAAGNPMPAPTDDG